MPEKSNEQSNSRLCVILGLASLVQVYVEMLNTPSGIVDMRLAWEKVSCYSNLEFQNVENALKALFDPFLFKQIAELDNGPDVGKYILYGKASFSLEKKTCFDNYLQFSSSSVS